MRSRLLAGVHIIINSHIVALKPFLNRLLSRSMLNQEERQAVLGMDGKLMPVAAHIDFVRLGQQVDQSCLIVEGLVGRFGQKRDGVRHITWI